MKRWLRFNAIGIIGAAVQLLCLRLSIATGMHYLVATALAVEVAIIHNYVWHLRWTWRDRPASRRETFVRFQLANGAVSLVSNVLLMRVLAGHLHVPPVPANLFAIAITSVVNYLLGDRWVFREASARRLTRDAASAPQRPFR